MIFGKRIKNPQTIIRIGMFFMALAGISNFWFRHHSPFSENAGDGIMGLLYGLAIGTLLLGIWRRGRQRSGEGCA